MNQRLPSLNAKDVLRALQKAGFVISRTSGSHVRLIHSEDPARSLTLPSHGARDIKRGTLRAIIAQAGLTVAEFIALL
jgi:predicted RNA binding protein YcfA (HicA-like mRNA interferase family)